MGVLATVRDLLQASSSAANRGNVRDTESKGAYWCTDCSERIRDVDVEGNEPPTCPSCGDEMTFERSAATTGCGC